MTWWERYWYDALIYLQKFKVWVQNLRSYLIEILQKLIMNRPNPFYFWTHIIYLAERKHKDARQSFEFSFDNFNPDNPLFNKITYHKQNKLLTRA
jgi:hypothetical protein